MSRKLKVFTIGHSTHPIEKFIAMLKSYEIDAIADVRSSPYSRYNSQYNRETLKESLRDENMKYVFLGKELGARSDDPCCYKYGKVDYNLLENTELFKTGIERVLNGSRKMKLALMCAEAEPLDCHRTILVSKKLADNNLDVFHILKDSSVETHTETLGRLIKQYMSQSSDLFMSEDEVRDKAYRKRGEEIAYIEDMAS